MVEIFSVAKSSVNDAGISFIGSGPGSGALPLVCALVVAMVIDLDALKVVGIKKANYFLMAAFPDLLWVAPQT